MSDYAHPRSNYRDLLEDEDVRRWYENLACGSPAGAEIYLRNLGNFCQLNNITPQELVRKPVSEIEDFFMDYVTSVQKKYADSHAQTRSRLSSRGLPTMVSGSNIR